MDTNDDDRPIMTDLDANETNEPTTLTPQPWLRRFASIVGFASAGVAPGGNQSLV
jgi:hypothetical protein